ncbi:MAG: hypothetical protein JNG84_05740 [Archangium sp.]|nr:hypothetical protein [Archangium sp.]
MKPSLEPSVVSANAAGSKKKPAVPFTRVLREASTSSKAAPRTLTGARTLPVAEAKPVVVVTMANPAQSLPAARRHVDAEAQRLTTVRAQHHAQAHQLDEVREEPLPPFERAILAKVEAALSAPPPPVTPVRQTVAMSGGTEAPLAVEPSRAQEAVKLIETIDVFVKSQRPAMRLGLAKSLGAEVEIERVGPKAISLKLLKSKAPVPRETLEALHRALRSRGLTVKQLSVE